MIKKLSVTTGILCCLSIGLSTFAVPQKSPDDTYYLEAPSSQQTSPAQLDNANDYFSESSGGQNNNYLPTTKVYKDPLENINRLVFAVNDKLDHYVFKPVATFYNNVLPRPINSAVNHFFSNLNDVPTILNDFLQANFYQGTSDVWRLSINSTGGILGFFDLAENLGLPKNPQDFGLTLAKWGWETSTYVVIPVFGPKTIRDTVALPADYLMSVYPYIDNVAERNSLYLWSKLNTRVQLLRFDNVYEQAALDRYVFLRNAYLQRRDYLVKRVHELGTPYTAKEVQAAASDENYYLNE